VGAIYGIEIAVGAIYGIEIAVAEPMTSVGIEILSRTHTSL
jgi:DNA-binding transcriptional regulator GbsR (MarR family)